MYEGQLGAETSKRWARDVIAYRKIVTLVRLL